MHGVSSMQHSGKKLISFYKKESPKKFPNECCDYESVDDESLQYTHAALV